MNIFSLNTIYAQQLNNNLTATDNTLPLPKACVYDDGENPKIDPDQCEEISNNEETLGNNNIFFTLNSPRSFDSYMCTLQERNGIVITSFDCTISPNVAEADFPDLDDGDYTFTVTAQRTISDNNPLTPDIVEEAASPPFNFRVGIGSDGGGGGSDSFDDGQQGQDVPVFAEAGENDGFDRLNPIWRACDPENIGARTEVAVQNGLVGMKYTAQGTVFFNDFVHQLNKFNTNDFVLEIKANFLSGVIVAELFPTAEDIHPVKTQADLYKLDPLLVTNEQTPKDGTNSPNRAPFDFESAETKCLYSAPKTATSWDIEGMDVRVSADVFAASNPPFRQCQLPQSEGVTYKVTFTLNDKDKKNLLHGHKDVLFTIFQQLSGEAPEYHGFLQFNPYEDDEKRISLSLDGKDIVTECKTKILY